MMILEKCEITTTPNWWIIFPHDKPDCIAFISLDDLKTSNSEEKRESPHVPNEKGLLITCWQEQM